jgi:hypothetical protein
LRGARRRRQAVSLFGASVFSAATALAGVVEWRPEDNPHVLTGDYVVGAGDVLRILPGVEVRLDPDVSLLVLGGRIEAIGTETDSIRFTRNQPATYWNSVVFRTSAGNQLSYSALEYSSLEPSVSDIYGGAVVLDAQSTVEISHSDIRETAYSGIYAQGSSELLIRDSHVHRTTRQGISTKWGASASVRRCRIHDIANGGAAINDGIEFTGDGVSAFYEVIDCVIFDVADDGIDIDFPLDATIAGTTVFDCADKGISVARESRATITNTAIHGCHTGLAVQSGATVDLANCAIYGGLYGLRAVVATEGYTGATANVKNLIVWGSTAPSVFKDGASTVNATFCDFEDPYAGTGNISADPLFVDPAGGDFHLRAFSPCIDAGSSEWPSPPADIDGEDRFDDPDVPNTGGGPIDYYDMGIDEVVGEALGVAVPGVTPHDRLQVLPNPTRAAARVRFRLSSPGPVSLRLFDGAGRLLGETVTGSLPAGEHWLPLPYAGPGERLPAGVLFVRIEGPGAIGRAKVVVR